jgi:hypothetical protein
VTSAVYMSFTGTGRSITMDADIRVRVPATMPGDLTFAIDLFGNSVPSSLRQLGGGGAIAPA